MKIIYKQPKGELSRLSLENFGIKNCCFKRLAYKSGEGDHFLKEHYHTFFELHMLVAGNAVYSVNGKQISLCKNEYLLIAPDTPHTLVSLTSDSEKYSVTFEKEDIAEIRYCRGSVSLRMRDNISLIEKEYSLKKETSPILAENAVFATIVTVLREAGYKEKSQTADIGDNTAAIAKQYISDNARLALTVSQVAEYCRMSSKQLTRLFLRFYGIAPGEYIKQKRIALAQKLLLDGSFTLKDISEYMNFSSEYYFNTFVKKYAGMPPGEYRKCFNILINNVNQPLKLAHNSDIIKSNKCSSEALL